MDRVEWAGDQLEAVGAIIAKSNCSTKDSSQRGKVWMAVGRAAMCWMAAEVR
jgi:hypothetical protein